MLPCARFFRPDAWISATVIGIGQGQALCILTETGLPTGLCSPFSTPLPGKKSVKSPTAPNTMPLGQLKLPRPP